MRGDGIRFGWRTLTGAVLVATILLHGLDSSFTVDGYTISILGLLVILALAGELESAKFAGMDVRFRKLALRRLEQKLEDLPSPTPIEEKGDGDVDRPADEKIAARDLEQIEADLDALSRREPSTAVSSLFVDIERTVNDLYEWLYGPDTAHLPLDRQVDLLARYEVVSGAEAQIVRDLAGLRSAYLHGRSVDLDEATRLIAVGRRMLPVLSVAQMRIGRAFTNRVAEVLEGVPGISFERRPRLDGDSIHRPDFLITEPFRYLIEAKVAGLHGSDALWRIEMSRRAFEADWAAVVSPPGRQKPMQPSKSRIWLTPVSIDHLQEWLELAVGEPFWPS